MSWTVHASGAIRERGDDATRTVTTYDETGAVSTRPYTAEENAAADAAAAQAAQLGSLEARIAALEATLLSTLPAPASGSEPTLAVLAGRQAGAIYPGQKIRWTDGNVWRCTKGPLNSNAAPATWPEGWAQETGLPPVVTAWAAGQTVKVNDLRTYGGKTYRCMQAHTTQTGWEPPSVPALWALQGWLH